MPWRTFYGHFLLGASQKKVHHRRAETVNCGNGKKVPGSVKEEGNNTKDVSLKSKRHSWLRYMSRHRTELQHVSSFTLRAV